MNGLLRKLSGDDLRSDGMVNEVEEEEVENPCSCTSPQNIFFQFENAFKMFLFVKGG